MSQDIYHKENPGTLHRLSVVLFLSIYLSVLKIFLRIYAGLKSYKTPSKCLHLNVSGITSHCFVFCEVYISNGITNDKTKSKQKNITHTSSLTCYTSGVKPRNGKSCDQNYRASVRLLIISLNECLPSIYESIRHVPSGVQNSTELECMNLFWLMMILSGSTRGYSRLPRLSLCSAEDIRRWVNVLSVVCCVMCSQ